MYIDDFLEFADATALGTATGTSNLGGTIDLDVVRDVGEGKQLYAVIQITTDLTSGGAATIFFQVVSDATATPNTAGTQSVHARSPSYTATALDAGEMVVIALPPMGYGAPIQYKRYLGLQSVVGTAALTAGAVNAFITPTPPAGERIKGFADALTRNPNPV